MSSIIDIKNGGPIPHPNSRKRAKSDYQQSKRPQALSEADAFNEAVRHLEIGAAMLRFLAQVNPHGLTAANHLHLHSASTNLKEAYDLIAEAHHAAN